MTIPQLRKIINSRFRTDADLTAFCIDFFPSVANRFSTGLDRLEKINLLLQTEDVDNIYDKIEIRHSKKLSQLKSSPLGFLFAVFCAIIIVLLILLMSINLKNDFLRSREKSDSEAEHPDASLNIFSGNKVLSEGQQTGQISRITNTDKKGSAVSGNKNRHVNLEKRVLDTARDNSFVIHNAGPTQINSIRGNHGSISITQNND